MLLRVKQLFQYYQRIARCAYERARPVSALDILVYSLGDNMVTERMQCCFHWSKGFERNYLTLGQGNNISFFVGVIQAIYINKRNGYYGTFGVGASIEHSSRR